MKLLLVLLLLAVPAVAQTFHPASVEVLFSPDGGCTDAIVAELGRAKKTVYVQAYSFTSAPIAGAVVEAHKRGVAVEVILDKGQRTEKYSSADFVAHAGIPVSIDEAVVITGSFNFTKGAEEKNAENLLVIRDPKLAERYLEKWREHQGHSMMCEGKWLRQSWRHQSQANNRFMRIRNRDTHSGAYFYIPCLEVFLQWFM